MRVGIRATFLGLRILALSAGLSVGAHAVLGQRSAVLKGRVLADPGDRPVAAASIAIPSLQLTTVSDSVGQFRLASILPGKHTVFVRRLGFDELITEISLATGDSVDADLLLTETAQLLPSVRVNGAARATARESNFERHRATGGGAFLDRAYLEKQGERRLSEVVRVLPGLDISRGNAANAAFVVGGRGALKSGAFSGSQASPCFAAVILDGIFVYPGPPAPPFDINSIRAQDVAGIEYYSGPARMPAEYNGARDACGLVVLWTR